MTEWIPIFRTIAQKGLDNLDASDAPDFLVSADLLPAFAMDMTEKALNGFTPSGEKADDLIELAMRLLEAMVPCRAGLIRIRESLQADPSRIIPLFLPVAGQATRLVEAAGLRTTPISGIRHSLRLMATLATCAPVFLKDTSAGLEKTLACLAQKLKAEA